MIKRTHEISRIAVKTALVLVLFSGMMYSQPYPDQEYTYENDSLIARIDSLNGMQVSIDGKSVILADGVLSGFVIFKPDSSEYPFDRGLPSWNGFVPNDYSSFKVSMRFYDNGWSPWLVIGFWKANIWSAYGTKSYSGGEIDIDNVVLYSYYTKWQFKADMKISNSLQPSPSLHKLCFFVSDQQTTDNVNITSLVADRPDAIFIPTEHFWQSSLDPEIGGDICSPTSVSMVLRSYGISVDPLQFARDTYCPYWEIFGIWPRVVQNAAEFGLNGSVTRYRTWSAAREILAAGGRVVMSVGSPLYPNGHLMMLAGFDSSGRPIVHDPARDDGESFMWDKTSLSRSWFNKGGIAYTFFPSDTLNVTGVKETSSTMPEETYLLNNYPNPFNPSTKIRYQIGSPADDGQGTSFVILKIFDVLGREVITLVNEEKSSGKYEVEFNASDYPTGIYMYSLYVRSGSGIYREYKKMMLIK